MPKVWPTARDLARAVMFNRYRQNFVLPNYTPHGWWECDVFELTAAGYFREYEIKLTRSDFKRDAGKEKRLYSADRRLLGVDPMSKHQLLAAGHAGGPSQFWYVTPAGLLAPDELPAWAGLIEVPHERYRLRMARRAPQLHREKAHQRVVEHARGTCYWRLHGLLCGAGVDEPDDWVI